MKTIYQSPNWNKRLKKWCKENRRKKAKAKNRKEKNANK